jgi:spoIIIJ-associated protein
MESLEVSAKTVDEAVELALRELGADREEVEVTVLSEGRTGFLGLHAEQARVEVRKLPSKEERSPVNVAEEILGELLSLMKVSASIGVEESSSARGVEGQSPVTLNITGEDLGILIGRRGQTLSSLQYLVYLMLSHQMQARVPLVIDVERYRERREEALRRLALHMAEQVSSTGRSVTLEPMLAGERRIIHLALQDYSGVTTQSIGQGEGRKVTILSQK